MKAELSFHIKDFGFFCLFASNPDVANRRRSTAAAWQPMGSLHHAGQQ
ncbi:hypothetical protein [Stenotrophomonas sp. Marseille-Q5258]|jgi:hypothetical protein|nr:hypothetical protein [Stenotrophomonas sp. Marseille-Q5258]